MTTTLTDWLLKTFQTNLRKKYRGNRKRDRFEIHATDIKELCLRQFLIMYKDGVPYQRKVKYFPPRTYLTFRIGEKIEDILREVLGGKKPKPLAIKIKDIYIVGSPDIEIEIGGKKYIIECKSIKKEYYDSLTEPLPDHILQLSFYLWLAERYPFLGYEKKGAIVYVPKQESEPTIKAFSVSLDKFYRNKFDNLVEQIKRFLKTGKLPKRVCMHEHAQLAHGCPVVQKCFTIDD